MGKRRALARRAPLCTLHTTEEAGWPLLTNAMWRYAPDFVPLSPVMFLIFFFKIYAYFRFCFLELIYSAT